MNGISLYKYNLEEARKFTEKSSYIFNQIQSLIFFQLKGTAIIMRKLCEAVHVMHKQGIAHGSLISDNIIIIKDKHGEFENLKLIHFDDSSDTNNNSPLAM